MKGNCNQEEGGGGVISIHIYLIASDAHGFTDVAMV
jgi:hypothetical protein